jgi:hypothetical protein
MTRHLTPSVVKQVPKTHLPSRALLNICDAVKSKMGYTCISGVRFRDYIKASRLERGELDLSVNSGTTFKSSLVSLPQNDFLLSPCPPVALRGH